MSDFQGLVLAILGLIGFSILWRWFIKGLWKDARNELLRAREQFKQVTGHYPPKSKIDNWFQWEKSKKKKV